MTKNKIHLFLLLPWVCLGCVSTEFNLATNREETLLFSTEKEIKIGNSLSRQLEKQLKLNTEIDVNDQAQRILDKLVAVCDRQELVYVIKIIDEDKINAVSLPGGYIYIYKGLIDKIENDDQLAGVIAHEIGHITAKHAIKRMQGAYGATLLQVLAISTGDGGVAAGVNSLLTTVFSSFSQQDEFEADRLAVKYTQKAGYDPEAMFFVLDLLRKEQEKEPLRTISYFRTHPYLHERTAALNHTITGQLEFRDYINLTGEVEGY